MKRWQLVCLLLGLLLVAAPFGRLANAEEDPEEYDDEGDDEGASKEDSEKDVIVGTEANWDEKIAKAKFALVEFYAPWCGHCKKLTPEWAKAATAMKAIDPSIVIAKVDATAEKKLAENYGVSGYPTIKWFVDGELALDYNGPRNADGIVKWVQKKSGPAAVTVASADDLKDLESKEEVVILGYFKALEGDDYAAFTKVAQTTEDVAFAETTSADAAKAAGLTAPGVAAITNFKGEERSTSVNTGDDLAAFVTAEKLPPTIEFNDQNSQKIFNSGIEKQLLLIAKASDLEGDSDVFQSYLKVAKSSLKGKLVFVTVDLDGTSKDPVVNFFGINEENAPIVVGFEMSKNKKYKLLEPISEESLEKFGEGVLDGTATVEYKSAPIPEDDMDGDVKIVVGKSFDAIVKDPSKDVLLEVYAPWCGHCKSLEPIYKKLAKRFKKVDSVVIAKMDGTENEHSDVEIKGFPSIVFFPAGDEKQAVTFEGGDRSLKALTKFIKANAKIPYELQKKSKGGDEDASDTKDEL